MKTRSFLLRAALLLFALSALLSGLFLLKPAVAANAAANDPDTAQFLSTFTPSRGSSVEMDGGCLTFTIGGASSYAEVSTSQYSTGSQWFVKYLTMRNTVLLHMKNNSPATSCTLSFITRSKREFDEEKSVSFPLETDGEFHTYFVDLSRNPLATGQLTGLRLSPQADFGSVSIDYISFEHEFVGDYAGKILSCTTDGSSVFVKGELNEEFAGKDVTLYRTGIENINQDLSFASALETVRAEGNSFSFEIPYFDGEITLLSSKFLAAVGKIKVAPMFDIENWRDMTENPYAFTLPERTVSVLDYGAKGDAFTNDTPAIQRAIDEVSGQGGGVVVVPGEEGDYGRRYRVSTIRLKDNVELRVEKGATLWQSLRPEDYPYSPTVGHDVPGIEWGHNGLAKNYPLVYGGGAKNIKLTGGGTVRLADTGNQHRLNGYSPAYSEYCASLIHLVPLGFYDCTNVEVTDITVLRTSCYHCVVYGCTNVYLGNITLTEDACLSGDGFSIGLGSKNVIVDRCFLYTDDDAIVLLAHSIGDQRGQTWWTNHPDGGDNRVRNVTLRHSAVTPGNIIVLITWGVDASDWTWQAMNGFDCYDNILGTYTTEAMKSMNSSCMNLCNSRNTYGYGGLSVPVLNFRIRNNSYRGSIANITALAGKTGWIADCGGVNVEGEFYDTSFYRGLGYWEYGGEYEKNVFAEGAEAVLDLDPALAKTYGTPSLFQGLYLLPGEYTFSADVKEEAGGTAKLFAREAYSGEEIASVPASEGKLTFTVYYEGVYDIGAEGTSETGRVTLSSYLLSGTEGERKAFFTQDFEGGREKELFEKFDFRLLTEGENTSLALAEGQIGGDLRFKSVYTDFDLKAESLSRREGLHYVRYGGNSAYYSVIFDGVRKTVSLLSRENGTSRKLSSAPADLPAGEWAQFGLSMKEGTLRVFLNGEQLLEQSGLKKLGGGYLRVGEYGADALFDNFAVAEAGTLTFGRSSLRTEPKPDEPDEPDEPDKPDVPDVPDVPDDPPKDPVGDDPSTDDAKQDEPEQNEPEQGGCGAMGEAWLLPLAAILFLRKKEKKQ